MGSSSKRQTTMAKMARERALQERRALKQQKKEERKAARAEGIDPLAPSETTAEGEAAGETPDGQTEGGPAPQA